MKYLTFIFSIIVAPSWSQHTKFRTTNPIPRQGEEVEIQYSLEKADLTELESKTNITDIESDILKKNDVAKGTFKLTLPLTETGNVTVGPFSFVVGGTMYHTGIITFNVHPQLPGNIRDGIWIRYTEKDGKTYLIVEQRVTNKTKVEKTTNQVTWTADNGDVAFAELDEEQLKKYGLEISSSSWRSHSQEVDKIDDQMFSGTVSFRHSTYVIEKADDFNGPQKISKKMFKNFPDNGFVDNEVTIN
jgi:hypothetical protein